MKRLAQCRELFVLAIFCFFRWSQKVAQAKSKRQSTLDSPCKSQTYGERRSNPTRSIHSVVAKVYMHAHVNGVHWMACRQHHHRKLMEAPPAADSDAVPLTRPQQEDNGGTAIIGAVPPIGFFGFLAYTRENQKTPLAVPPAWSGTARPWRFRSPWAVPSAFGTDLFAFGRTAVFSLASLLSPFPPATSPLVLRTSSLPPLWNVDKFHGRTLVDLTLTYKPRRIHA